MKPKMSCSARIAGVYVHHFWLTGHPIFKQKQTILYFMGDPLKFVFKNKLNLYYNTQVRIR